MRYAVPCVALMLLQASCKPHPDAHVQLMDEVDTAIVMPKKALPLDRYAQYFSLRPDGKVMAFFSADVRDDTPKPADYSCLESSGHSIAYVPCGPDNRPRAGEKHWVSYKVMPYASDGGCMFINIVYDPSLHRVEQLSCNGSLEPPM